MKARQLDIFTNRVYNVTAVSYLNCKADLGVECDPAEIMCGLKLHIAGCIVKENLWRVQR